MQNSPAPALDPEAVVSYAHDTLRKHWGYTSFRPLQLDIIKSVMARSDTFGLMPTGGGKSITFQVPALLLPGVTIVVTPLISLMKDQVDNLRKRKVKAVYFHSGMRMREVRLAWEKVTNGGAKLIYVSPERLRNVRFMQEVRNLNVSLIVVDEAHCISQWGYDFRPAYLNIKKLRDVATSAPVLALTATATPVVAEDIKRQLRLQDCNLFKMSFSRENLNYVVRSSDTKIYDVFHILSRTQGSSIVYVRSRKRTREIAEYLTSAGISATFYHAGLEFKVKEQRQNDWQAGNVRVMVATNAFGMGIDKPDVRVVVHYDMPPSLEEYYQEAGRAGRDGLPSYVVLLVNDNDGATMRRRVTESFPPRDYIRQVYDRVCNYLSVTVGEGYEKLFPFDIDKFCDTFHYQQRQCLAAINLLQQACYLEYVAESESRSRVKILVTREELYDMRSVSDSAERVLGDILRNYPGLFADYVFINEDLVSSDLQMDGKEIYLALLELTRCKIIHYVPKSRMPYMYFPTSREESKYLSIGKDIYEERKSVISNRVEYMLKYGFQNKGCRENILLEYFGEKATCDCGRCDVCRGREKRKDRGRSREDAIRNTLDYLKSHPNGADINALKNYVNIQDTEIHNILSFLCNEGFAIYSDGRYYCGSRS